MLPLIALIVFLGVYPKPVLDRIRAVGAGAVAHVEREVPELRRSPIPNTKATRVGGRDERGERGDAGEESDDPTFPTSDVEEAGR